MNTGRATDRDVRNVVNFQKFTVILDDYQKPRGRNKACMIAMHAKAYC